MQSRISARRSGLRLQVEGAEVPWPEDGERPPVERRDPTHSQALGGGHDQRVGQARPMFGGLVQELSCPFEIAVGRRDQSDRAGRDRTHERESRFGTELPLEQAIEIAKSKGTEQEWLVSPREPAHRGAVIEIGSVGRGDNDAGVEKDGQRVTGTGYRLPAGRRPASRLVIERPSSESRPWVLCPMARNGISGSGSCSARYASRAEVMTAVFVVRARLA